MNYGAAAFLQSLISYKTTTFAPKLDDYGKREFNNYRAVREAADYEQFGNPAT